MYVCLCISIPNIIHYFILQALARQLWASKESLHMSSQLAEHLEDKLNDSEEEVDSLQRQCDLLQLELNKSNSHLHQSEATVEEQTTELLQLRTKVDDLKLERRRLEQELEEERRKPVSPVTPLTPMGTTSADCTLLAEELASLRSKLDQSQACRMKLERQLSDVTLEKADLEQQVALAEETADELRLRLAATEDTDSGVVSASTKLKRSKSMHHSGRQRFTAWRPSHTSSPLKSPQTLDPTPSLHSHGSELHSPTTIPSLWSELGSQCVTLQDQFDQWVQKCNCSASLEYQKYVKTRHVPQQEGSKESLQPFKHIFDELFSSIKETTAVANRLLAKGQAQAKA